MEDRSFSVAVSRVSRLGLDYVAELSQSPGETPACAEIHMLDPRAVQMLRCQGGTFDHIPLGVLEFCVDDT